MCFEGYMAVCGWRGSVQCVLMGWQGAGGEVVFTVFDGYMAGCGWRGGVDERMINQRMMSCITNYQLSLLFQKLTE